MGLPLQLFENLMDDDDWSFVIKVHALVEAAVSSLLVYGFKNEQLSTVANALPRGNRRFGKIAFVKQLDLLSDKARAFILKLSQLRNQLAHQIENVTFSFSSPTKRTREVANACVEAAIVYIGAVPTEHPDFFVWARANPKSLVWMAIGVLLTQIYPHSKAFHDEKLIQRVLAQFKT